MKIHMTFRQMDATEALKRRVNDASEKFRKFVPEQTEATWIFYIDADVHVADLRLHGPHIDYFVQSKTGDLYQSIDEAADRMEKQLKKHKEIVKDHLHRARPLPTDESENVEE